MLRLRAKAKAKASLEQEQAVTAPREQMREVIKQMESGGNYKADHPAFNEAGEKAVGAYGVVPRFWFGEFLFKRSTKNVMWFSRLRCPRIVYFDCVPWSTC